MRRTQEENLEGIYLPSGKKEVRESASDVWQDGDRALPAAVGIGAVRSTAKVGGWGVDLSPRRKDILALASIIPSEIPEGGV